MDKGKRSEIGFFEKFLTIWVVLCMVTGILIGKFIPSIPEFLGKFEPANVSSRSYSHLVDDHPMMLKVDFQSIKDVGKTETPIRRMGDQLAHRLYDVRPPGCFPCDFQDTDPGGSREGYLAGAILQGAARALRDRLESLERKRRYTVVQVATNDLIILIAFTPIVAFLLGIGGVKIPWDTLLLSVILFVVIPLAGGVITRSYITKRRGAEYLEKTFIPKFGNITIIGLLLTLIIIFSFQGHVILENPLHIVLIAVPLVLQTFLIFFIAYLSSKALRLSHDIAAPAGMIGASNFFELAVAVAISLFGTKSPVALATIVGVLVEVPVMLILVKIANSTKKWFSRLPS